MWVPNWQNIAAGVATRLRFAFTVVAAILVTTATMNYYQFQSLNEAVRNLTVSVFTVFVRTEETERSLKNLVILLQQVNRTTETSEIQPFENALRTRLADLRVDVSELGTFAQTGTLADGMMLSLDKIEQSAFDILQTKAAVLRSQTRLGLIENAMRLSRNTIRTTLEALSLERAISVEQDIVATQNDIATTLIDIERRYSQELLRASAISSIALEIESVVDKTLSLRSFAKRSEVRQAGDALRFKLRSVTTLLSQIEDDAARVTLAKSIIDMRNQIFGDQGSVLVTDRLLTQQSALQSQVLSQLEPSNDISALSNQLTIETREALDLAKANVSRKITQMTLTIAVATLTALVAIAATIFFVVERQISARMSKLTNAVLSIAAGERDYTVNVAGHDELGQMAKSLEVFKSNAQELVRSNQELEKFAYVAAHDLRSPLRAIQDLSEWIKEDEDNTLSPDSIEFMSLLTNRIKRLNNLLTDLLDYSRVGSEASALDEVQLSEIIQETSEMLDPDQAFNITYTSDIDKIVTVATPLRQIVLNLINNSIKHHDRPKGQIDFSAMIVGNRLHCTVKDDGPGIDTKYHGKIFGLFETLRPRDEVEGSGLGLAIVRKLIEHYNGTIDVASDPDAGRGTAFHFDLPLGTIENYQNRVAA